MIVSILYSSPTFEAVDYNERKVSQGTATLLAAENLGYLDQTKDYTANQVREYLMDYSSRNEHIKKPQLHVSFSCKGQEMKPEELVQFARQWLADMGYNEPKQPLLIYSHQDTENNHIHVISSRINPMGQKIDHSHERVRSKAFVNKTLGVDTKADLQAALNNALTYKFESIAQWQAVLEASGYDVSAKGDQLHIARNGAYQHHIPLAEVETHITTRYANKQRLKQLKALLTKYQALSCCKGELQELMKRKFGVDLVFFGGKDNPRGYFVIDHKQKQVYKGSSVLKIADLLYFEPAVEKLKRIDAFIDSQLEEKPRITERELAHTLRKYYGATYRKGEVLIGGEKLTLKEYMQESLQYNNTVAWLSTYAYGSQAEKEALCAHFKVAAEHLTPHTATAISYAYTLQAAQTITPNVRSIQQAREAFETWGIQLIFHKGRFYAIDTKGKSICDLQTHGLSLFPTLSTKQAMQHHPSILAAHRRLDSGRSSAAANREHEVGTHGNYDDIDDARRLKR